MAERQEGSNRGRPSIDWELAFAYYVSSPDTERSYRAVAEHFGVSVRTVEAHGRQGHWRERLGQIKAQAAETADERLAAERAEKLAEIDLLIGASLTSYAQQLRAGSVRVSPSDLLRLYKLREELWAQGDAERASQPADPTVTGDPVDAEQRKRDLILALEEAGVFERLRAHARPSADDGAPDPQTRPAGTSEGDDVGAADAA